MKRSDFEEEQIQKEFLEAGVDVEKSKTWENL